MSRNIAVTIPLVNRHCDIVVAQNAVMHSGIGLRIRRARKTRGLTQVKLAKLSGVPQASISEVETGEHKAPSGTNIVRIAQALKVSPEWLATGKGPMEASDTPLSPEAVQVARDWEVLTPEVREKIAGMIAQLAASARSFGDAVDDERVEAAYGRPGRKEKT